MKTKRLKWLFYFYKLLLSFIVLHVIISLNSFPTSNPCPEQKNFIPLFSFYQKKKLKCTVYILHKLLIISITIYWIDIINPTPK